MARELEAGETGVVCVGFVLPTASTMQRRSAMSSNFHPTYILSTVVYHIPAHVCRPGAVDPPGDAWDWSPEGAVCAWVASNAAPVLSARLAARFGPGAFLSFSRVEQSNETRVVVLSPSPPSTHSTQAPICQTG